MLASYVVPTLTPGATGGTKDLSVTAKGSMECLAQTSDIDKAGSQSPCREVHRDTVACMHTHTHTRLHTSMHLPELAQSAYASKMQGLNAQIDSWVTGQDTGELRNA